MATDVRALRLSKLKSRYAIPGYVLIAWNVIDFLSTVDFIAALPSRIATSRIGELVLSQHVSTWFGVVGVLYLIVLVQWRPRPSSELILLGDLPNSQPEATTPRIRSLPLDAHRPKAWVREHARTLANELRHLASAHRKEAPSAPGRLRIRSDGARVAEAIEAYRVQFADRVVSLYQNAFWTSAYRAPDESPGLLGLLEAGPPPTPTTLNEIVGIANEIDARSLPRDE
jgi:hypothetical protein